MIATLWIGAIISMEAVWATVTNFGFSWRKALLSTSTNRATLNQRLYFSLGSS